MDTKKGIGQEHGIGAGMESEQSHLPQAENIEGFFEGEQQVPAEAQETQAALEVPVPPKAPEAPVASVDQILEGDTAEPSVSAGDAAVDTMAHSHVIDGKPIDDLHATVEALNNRE